jgi:hypothetical protein
MLAPVRSTALRTRTRTARLALACLALLVGGVALPAAGEDRLAAKGDTLRGQVVGIGSDGVEFDPIQGKGTIQVPWASIERLESEGAFFVMHGEQGEVTGRLLGVEPGDPPVVLVGDDPATAVRIEVDTIFAGFAENGEGLSRLDRLRSRYRYWSASLSAGALFVDSTTDQLGGHVALLVERNQGPTHLLLEGAARYASQQERRADRDTTESVAWGLVRGEYDVTERFYTFASTRATYDGVQHLSLRLEPRVGVGVHFVKSERFNLSGDIGGAWVYEDYFGKTTTDGIRRNRGSDDYWAIAFGANADAKLPLGIVWRGRAEYLPAVDDWERDYLLRGETSLEFPMLEWLALTLAVSDEYDNTPAGGTTRNRFTSTAALTLRF